MQKKDTNVDVILDVLKHTQVVFPESVFINSLMLQYQQRGSLSKKQLEGLHSKASKVNMIPPGKLATLQAIILRKPTKYRSDVSPQTKEESTEPAKKLVTDILKKYPLHKRVLYFKMKLDKADLLTVTEKGELDKFHKLLL